MAEGTSAAAESRSRTARRMSSRAHNAAAARWSDAAAGAVRHRFRRQASAHPPSDRAAKIVTPHSQTPTSHESQLDPPGPETADETEPDAAFPGTAATTGAGCDALEAATRNVTAGARTISARAPQKIA